ncbi:metallophosphoesterase [Neorhizobium sp. NPDC001467]|uniref:metallophosphoesterase n=1 Tax=Neorhizobium sp. NPDC001467 TaxID=3390595 RepID=UPI003CFE0710
MSDLHLEASPMRLPLKIPQADVCVCAGDLTIHGIVPSLRWLHDHVSFRMPVVFVAGNHEFYDAVFRDSLQAAREAAPLLDDIHFLDGGTVTLGGTLFIGATLWTDFAMLGDAQAAMALAGERMNDYRRTLYLQDPPQPLTPALTREKHVADRVAIEHALAATPKDGPRVVVTHHLPSRLSLPERQRERPISAAYASDLEETILAAKPDLWIHGHVHVACDYRIGETRVLANPRGYPGERTHTLFDAGLVVEV